VELRHAVDESQLDPQKQYYVLRAVSGGKSLLDLRRAVSGESSNAQDDVMFTTMYGDYAGVAGSLPTSPVGFLVGVSSPVGVTERAEGVRLATRSVDAARQMGRSGLVSMRDLSVAASVATDQELVEILTARYIEPLRASGAAGQAILDT